MSEEYKKNFDAWNEYAKTLDVKEFKGISLEGEIWWCSIGINIGSEEDGKNDQFERPVLIFRKFGEDTTWIIPCTSKPAEKESRVLYTLTKSEMIETIKLSQLRLVSNKRLLRHAGKISAEDFKNIRESLKSLM